MKANERRANRFRALLTFLLGFLGVLPGWALDRSLSVYQYQCRSMTRQNGLPANAVTAILQTSDGYLWLGTPVGLARFDGDECKLLDPSSTRTINVTGLSTARQGGLWLGLESGGIAWFDGKQIQAQRPAEWGGVAPNVHAVLETAAGDLWVAGETLAARLASGRTYVQVLPNAQQPEPHDVTALYQDRQGRVWLGTARKGLFCWQEGVLTKFPDERMDQFILRAVALDREGALWVGTERGLVRYGTDFRPLPAPFPWYEVRALLVDDQGAVWAGTSGGGVARLDGTVPTLLRKADGLADDFVTCLAQDQEGSLWIGTRNGLSQLSQYQIPTYSRSEGLPGEVCTSVSASRRGGVWISSDQGLVYYDGTAQTYSTDQGLRTPYVQQAYEARNGDVYLINGLMDIEVLSRSNVVARYPNNRWPTAIGEDQESVVVAANANLYRVTPEALTPFEFVGAKPVLTWVFGITCVRDGALWLATGDGVFRVQAGVATQFSTKEGLTDTRVRWVSEDKDGVIWAASQMGLARIKDGRLRLITREQGLFDNLLYAVVVDEKGTLWADSGRGFFSVALGSLNEVCDGRAGQVVCTAYRGASAVKSSEKNQQVPAGCRSRDGRIWFPTAQGVVGIVPTNLAAVPKLAPVQIQRVRANGSELPLAARAVVPVGKGEIEFYYADLSYVAPEKIRYRYRLNGYDKEWVEAGSRRSAFYTNLRPGQHEFLVQACCDEGPWSDAGSGFSIELLPRFYQTGWCLGLVILVVCLALAGIYGLRVRHLERKQRQLQAAHDLLEARVRERTAELAAANTSLRTEIEERKRMEAEMERIHGQLLEASRQAGQAEVAINVLHNIGNALNSVNVSTNWIQDRLKELRLPRLAKAVEMMEEHVADLGPYLTQDAKGRHLPRYFKEVSGDLEADRGALLTEVEGLTEKVGRIKDIVARQQTYAHVSGVREAASLAELADHAIRIHAPCQRLAIELRRDYETLPPVMMDKYKVVQILTVLLDNAVRACQGAPQPGKWICVRLRREGLDRARLVVADNGLGIAPQDMTRIFAQGFTTWKGGSGFGLHSAALSARELGGTLSAQSDGPGRGATFTLELPL